MQKLNAHVYLSIDGIALCQAVMRQNIHLVDSCALCTGKTNVQNRMSSFAQ